MIHKLVLLALLFGRISNAQARPITTIVHSVCDILAHRDQFEGTEVTVESILVASRHDAVLAGKPCGKGIYISHEAGRKDGKWPVFDSDLAKSATGLETAQLRVKLKGIYHNGVRDGRRTIRQIELQEILDVEFLSKP